MVKVALFETNMSELSRVSSLIEKGMTESTINELLKSLNISFSVENCSRLLTHVICEALDSYTQQSQRYVVMGNDGYILPEEIEGSEFEDDYKDLMDLLFKTYNRITVEKEGEKRGRGAGSEKYKYGIPIEDGRYLLPLSTTTNIMVTMNGSRLLPFVRMLLEKGQAEAHDCAMQVLTYLDNPEIQNAIYDLANENHRSRIKTQKYYQPLFDMIDKDVVLFDDFQQPIQRIALGGIASTNANTPSVVHSKWLPEYQTVGNPKKFANHNLLKKRFQRFLGKWMKDNNKKRLTASIEEKALNAFKDSLEPTERARLIAERILGYGHNSIAEHSRTTYGTEQSLTSYHQFERHRLPVNHREALELIPPERDIFVPPTVAKSKVYHEFIDAVDRVKLFRQKLLMSQNEMLILASSYLLLNADGVKVISSTNARTDIEMLEKRTCNNSQWEIQDRAVAILKTLRHTMPYLYDRAGPPCTKGKCPEGKLTCGKISEERNKWGYFPN